MATPFVQSPFNVTFRRELISCLIQFFQPTWNIYITLTAWFKEHRWRWLRPKQYDGCHWNRFNTYLLEAWMDFATQSSWGLARLSLGWALFGIAPQQEAMQARLGWALFGRLGWALFGIVPQRRPDLGGFYTFKSKWCQPKSGLCCGTIPQELLSRDIWLQSCNASRALIQRCCLMLRCYKGDTIFEPIMRCPNASSVVRLIL